MISIGIIHLNPSEVGNIKAEIKKTPSTVLPAQTGYSSPSIVVFHCKQEQFSNTIEAISDKFSTINRVSEIRNINPEIIKLIEKPFDTFPDNSRHGIFECKGIETILSSANTTSFNDDVKILQITLADNPQNFSMFVFSGTEEAIEDSISTAKNIAESTGQVINKHLGNNQA